MSQDATQGGTDVLERTDTDLKVTPDKPWQVILWNDPVNLVDYVTSTLMRVLEISKEQAETYMLLAHTEGRAAVVDGTKEKCETVANKLMAATLWATMEKS